MNRGFFHPSAEISVARLVIGSALFLAILAARPASATAHFWENTIPAPNALNDVIVFSDSVWAAGDAGTVVRWDGTVWDTLWGAHWLVDEGDSFQGVWGTSSSDVWVVSYLGAVLHFDGSTWSLEWTAGQHLGAVWGTSSSDIWVVGRNGYAAHWDGSAWTAASTATSSYLRAVWGTGSSDIWAVGEAGALVHWDGSAWASVTSGTSNSLRDVWGTASNDVWAVGASGTVLHWDGSAWSAAGPSTTSSFLAVGGLGADDVYAAGGLTTIYHWDGSAWSAQTNPASLLVNGISHTDDGSGSLWAVGGAGAVLRGGASGWEEISTGERATLSGIWLTDPGHGFAVGASGTILRKSGWAWEATDSGVTSDLFDVWAPAANRAFAVGASGTLLEWDGASWSPVSSGVTGDITAVHGWAPDLGVAVADGPSILWYDGSSWSAGPIPALTGTPTDVWGPAANFVVVTDDAGEIATWDGTMWSIDSTTFSGTPLYCVGGGGPNDIYVGGASGFAAHWDGSSWTDISPASAGGDFVGLWFDGSAAWFVDSAGEALVYSGVWSTPLQVTALGGLGAVHGLPHLWTWFAGGWGAVLRLGQTAVTVEPCSTVEGSACSFLIRTDDPVDASSDDKLVDYVTQAQTAQEGADYIAASGTATIPGNPHTHSWTTVDVTTLDDATDEPDETFRLELSNPVQATLLGAAAVGTITDDDPPADVSISDASVNEASGPAAVTITVSPASGFPITVHVLSTDGTATDPEDYGGRDTDIVLPVGTTSWDVLFPIVDDSLIESDETFTVSLTSVTNGNLLDGTATVTIVDDDNPCGAPGDADGDCSVTAADLALVVRLVDDTSVTAGGDPDCDGDTSVTGSDIRCMLPKIFGP